MSVCADLNVQVALESLLGFGVCVCVREGLVGVGGESFFSPVSMSLVVQNYRFQNRFDGGLPEQLVDQEV